MGVLDDYLDEGGTTPPVQPRVLDSYLEGGDQPDEPVTITTPSKPKPQVMTIGEALKEFGRRNMNAGLGVYQGFSNIMNHLDPFRYTGIPGIASSGEIAEQQNKLMDKRAAGLENNSQFQKGQSIGEMIGAIPALAGLNAGIEALPMIGPFLSGAGGESLVGKGLSAATGGAITGGSYNALTGNDVAQGAEAGAVAGPIARGISGILNHTPAGQPPEPYAQKLGEALERDNIAPQDAAKRLAELGPNATIADLGENTKGVARAIAGLPGQGKEDITNFLEQRQAERPDRIIQAVTEGLNIPPGLSSDKVVDQLVEQRAENAAPLYKAAYDANPNVSSPEINRILKTPAGQKALAVASIKMQNDMSLMGVPDKELAEQARLTETYQPGGIASGLKLRSHDYVKRAFDDQIGAAQRAGEGDNVRILTGLKNRYIKTLDTADITAKAGPNSLVPEGGLYKQARAAFSEPSQSIEAVEAGKDFIKNGISGNISSLKDMSEADKQFFRIGVGQQISDMLDNTSEGRNAVKAIFGKPKVQKALQSVFPSAEAYDKFANIIKNEGVFADTERAILQGSRTTPMAKEIENLSIKPSKAAEMSKHAYELGTRNAAGKALYLGKGVINRLTEPQPLPPEQMNKLTNAILSPNIQNTPVSAQSAPLTTYINHLMQQVAVPMIGANQTTQP